MPKMDQKRIDRMACRAWAAFVSVCVCMLAAAQVQVPSAPDQVPYEKTVRAYRSGPVAETVQIHVKDDQGRERRSDVLIKLDAGATGEGPLRARIELGDLAFSLDGSRLLATHRLEKNRYAEFTLAAGPVLQALESVMPALVLPQLVLADPANARIDSLGLPLNAGAVRWEPGVVDRPTGKMLYTGNAGDAKLRMLVDRTTGRLASLQVVSASGPIRNLDLTVRSTNPGPVETWQVEVEGRKRVDGLIDLMAESDQVRVGERFPSSMTLLTTARRPWKELRDDLASVFIFVQPDVSELEHPDGAVKDAAVVRLQRETRVANQLVRRLEAGSGGKWAARCVVILPTSALKPEITSVLLSLLNPKDSAVLDRPDNAPILAVAQSFDYDTILGGGLGGAVVIDRGRIVRAIITLDDADAAEQKIREALGSLN